VESARRALAIGGLSVVDVELIPTHGGSIRLRARPTAVAGEQSQRMIDVLAQEKTAGLHELSGYTDFAERVTRVQLDLLRFLTDAAQQGRTVVGYGAPGKGKTLLNHCGIRSDLLQYTVDRNQYKHGRFTPGNPRSHPATGTNRRGQARLPTDPSLRPQEGIDRSAVLCRPARCRSAQSPAQGR
jgi:hypothetical protein